MIISTSNKRQVIDITDRINDQLKGDGIINVFAKHTTTAVTLADLDPGTDEDLLDAIQSLTPDKRWRHPHDPSHFPDHFWSSIIGLSVTVPFRKDKLVLGTWQRVVLIELDGPREREIELTMIPTSNN